MNYAENEDDVDEEPEDGPTAPKRGRKAKPKGGETKKGGKAKDDNHNDVKVEEDEEEEEEEDKKKDAGEDVKDVVKGKSKGAGKRGKKAAPAPVEPPPAPVTKSIVMKSKAPVDAECPVKGEWPPACFKPVTYILKLLV